MEKKVENKTPMWIQFLLLVGGIAVIGYIVSKLINFVVGLIAPKKRTRRVFISHSWRYDNSYKTLIKRFNYHGFKYYNHSIPEENALDENTARSIENGIRKKIWSCSKVLVLADQYTDSYWIKREVEIAKKLGKEVIAIKPSKSAIVPYYLRKEADRIVDLNAKYIIDLIEE